MSRIVKSSEVVDNRRTVNGLAPAVPFTGNSVLKNRVAGGVGNSVIHAEPPRDAYRDELNRLIIEISDAKDELNGICAEIVSARDEIAQIKEQAEVEKQALERLKLDESLMDNSEFEIRQRAIKTMHEEAEAAAAGLMQKAESDAEEIRQTARAEGYQDGYREGLTKGHAEASDAFKSEAEPKLSELSDMISVLTGYGGKLMKEKEDEFVTLVTAVAGKVIGRVITKDPKFILDMLKDAMAKNHRENYINITVSEDMLPARAAASGEIIGLIEEMANNVSVMVERDEREGVCVIETPKGVTDMSVDIQLENIREMLLEA